MELTPKVPKIAWKSVSMKNRGTAGDKGAGFDRAGARNFLRAPSANLRVRWLPVTLFRAGKVKAVRKRSSTPS